MLISGIKRLIQQVYFKWYSIYHMQFSYLILLFRADVNLQILNASFRN